MNDYKLYVRVRLSRGPNGEPVVRAYGMTSHDPALLGCLSASGGAVLATLPVAPGPALRVSVEDAEAALRRVERGWLS